MDELELLARLIQCEAGGEGDVGMAAVATVIANRVFTMQGEYGRYNTVRDVAYAPRQFECVTGNRGNQNIWNMNPEQIHYDIANWVLEGNRLGAVYNALWFFNPFSSTCPSNFPRQVGNALTRIGDHCFYYPSELYWST